jgi:hypothetical protein
MAFVFTNSTEYHYFSSWPHLANKAHTSLNISEDTIIPTLDFNIREKKHTSGLITKIFFVLNLS